jgi:DNA-binding transcriptional ArsR family regulator
VTPAGQARQAPVFAALGDATRLRLLARLGGGSPLSISALTENSGISRQAVTKHLQVLARAGLVHDTAQGRERVYRIDAAPLREVAEWCEQYRRAWEESFDRLDLYVQTLTSKDEKP